MWEISTMCYLKLFLYFCVAFMYLSLCVAEDSSIKILHASDMCFDFPMNWGNDYGHPLDITVSLTECESNEKVINITKVEYVRPEDKGDECYGIGCCTRGGETCTANMESHFFDKYQTIKAQCDGKPICELSIGSVAMDEQCPIDYALDCNTGSTGLLSGRSYWCWARRVTVYYTCESPPTVSTMLTTSEGSVTPAITASNANPSTDHWSKNLTHPSQETTTFFAPQTDNNTKGIVGVTVGAVLGVMLLIIISLAVICVMIKRKRSKGGLEKKEPSHIPLQNMDLNNPVYMAPRTSTIEGNYMFETNVENESPNAGPKNQGSGYYLLETDVPEHEKAGDNTDGSVEYAQPRKFKPTAKNSEVNGKPSEQVEVEKGTSAETTDGNTYYNIHNVKAAKPNVQLKLDKDPSPNVGDETEKGNDDEEGDMSKEYEVMASPITSLTENQYYESEQNNTTPSAEYYNQRDIEKRNQDSYVPAASPIKEMTENQYYESEQGESPSEDYYNHVDVANAGYMHMGSPKKSDLTKSGISESDINKLNVANDNNIENSEVSDKPGSLDQNANEHYANVYGHFEGEGRKRAT